MQGKSALDLGNKEVSNGTKKIKVQEQTETPRQETQTHDGTASEIQATQEDWVHDGTSAATAYIGFAGFRSVLTDNRRDLGRLHAMRESLETVSCCLDS
jgi:hypothetical protein